MLKFALVMAVYIVYNYLLLLVNVHTLEYYLLKEFFTRFVNFYIQSVIYIQKIGKIIILLLFILIILFNLIALYGLSLLY
jgi:hypothetical protein